MAHIYILKFYRVEFDDTAETDVPLIGDDLAELKTQACEALYTRFEDKASARRKRSKVPHHAAMLGEGDLVVARFRVEAASNRPQGAYEIPPHLWLDNMPGTPSPEIRERLQAQ
ncbi:hypothetical protein V6R85_24030 [Agrobacterium sp. CCNWLW32]|uniref:hypothetical protein n=1 Tax=Agrobacterium sp. CCNWLW32 TaxID=3122072 RepID=UPI0030101E68